MAVFETLFILTGLLVGLTSRGGMYLFLLPLAVVAFVLAIMNRPNPTGSRAKKIVSSILSAAYLVAVIACPLAFFQSGSQKSDDAPKKEPTVALRAPDDKDLSGIEEKVDKIYSMLADMKVEYSLIGKSDLERVKAEIAIHDDELIECDPTKMKGCMEFTNYGTESDSNRFYTVSLHWTLPRFQVYPKRVHWKIIKGLLGEDLTDADTVLDARHIEKIHKRALYRQAEEYKRNIEFELRNYPNDWYYDSAHTEVAATLKYEREDSIDVAFDSLLWTTYYISNAGYDAGAAGGYFYEYHRTFSKRDGALVDSTIFNPDEKEKIVSLLRKYAEKYDARPNAIGMDFKLEPSFLKDGIGFDGSSFEIGEHTHGSVMIVVPYEEILPHMQTWARREFGLTEGGGP
ncbi:hypothetical protein SAMN05720781_1583 [Fibrobacter sp. UWT3]|uniref:hypothetical protein n=1 Tax=Fibrobacter sp. UWT3 TaxID=1896225 RepID=UPI000BD8EEF5|nr:hypothetical protein [Fibrobacter sp. UWT3]SOE75397.1 hypothetical protein SAMN05720781_1583 [Fibrobacter sp. UWT3]